MMTHPLQALKEAIKQLNEQKIKAAVKQLGPDSYDDVVLALYYIENWRFDIDEEKELQSKKAKQTLVAYQRALRRTEAAYKNLSEVYRGLVELSDDSDITLKQIKNEQEVCERMLKEVPTRKGGSVDLKRFIALEALTLIRKYDWPDSLTRRGSPWLKLCGIFYGDDKENFYEVCREVKTLRPKPRQK
jgi:hypothetical protein